MMALIEGSHSTRTPITMLAAFSWFCFLFLFLFFSSLPSFYLSLSFSRAERAKGEMNRGGGFGKEGGGEKERKNTFYSFGHGD